jgi:gliding motility-associated-like protein
VRVIVVERGQVYVPNIFTPNGDGNNDLLTVTAHPGIDRIDEFSIYDRWGDLMFGVSNVDPKTETIAWDGTFAGQELNAAVYSYVMKLRLITGREEIKTGDITLLR